MLIKSILSIGFALSGAMSIDAFRYCRGKHTIFEMGTLLSFAVALFGLILIWATHIPFQAERPTGFAVIGFCWLVIISNMVLAHHVKVEMRK